MVESCSLFFVKMKGYHGIIFFIRDVLQRAVVFSGGSYIKSLIPEVDGPCSTCKPGAAQYAVTLTEYELVMGRHLLIFTNRYKSVGDQRWWNKPGCIKPREERCILHFILNQGIGGYKSVRVIRVFLENKLLSASASKR